MKKSLGIIFVLFILVSAGAFAQEVAQVSVEVSEDVSNYIDEFLEKGGVAKEQTKEIKQIDQEDLPDKVDIKEINENKIGIYSVNYTQDNAPKNVYVVTYSTNKFKKTPSLKNVQYFNFGYADSSNVASYLDSSTGVATGADRGYVMMRPGSITGLSSSLDLSGEGYVLIKVYINGEDTGFENRISTNEGQKKDYDLQSEEIIEYVPGDVLSVYVQTSGNVTWSNVISMVETTG
jgi:hypothetical protein